jgi:glutamate-1-semialdehyde 2,1-aminomutase
VTRDPAGRVESASTVPWAKARLERGYAIHELVFAILFLVILAIPFRARQLSLACAEVVLTELMTRAEHDRIAGLGGRLADGIEAAAAERGLDWRAHRFGARTGYCLLPDLPRTAHEAHASLDPLFTDTRRVFFANRGVWDAISTSGPHAGFAHQTADVDVYLEILDDFLNEMCSR